MKISVAVPVRDEEKTVGALLGRLLQQTRTPHEIIITDGGSRDATAEIVAGFVNQGAPVKLIRAGEALPGRGRNLAAAQATGDWLAFIDAGIRPASDWLELMASKAEGDSTIDVVYGGWEPVTDTFFLECAAITYVPPPTLLNGVLMRPRFIASSLMKRNVWRSVGGFPEDLRSGEDLLFMDRVANAGFNAVFEPSAVVWWELRPSFGTTFRKFVVYARNNLRAGLWRHWQASIFSRYAVLLILGIILGFIRPALLWLPLGLWVLMLLARSIMAVHRNRLCYPASLGRNLKRLLMLVPLIATIDAAAFIGSFQWLIMDWLQGQGKTAVEAGNDA